MQATSQNPMSEENRRSGESSSRPLISSNRVEGTEVYGADQEHIGEIQHLMIDKVSGQVAYAVMSFGGILGMGKKSYPLPWNMLKYDTELDGYRTEIVKEQLEDAPEYNEEDFSDEDFSQNWAERFGRQFDSSDSSRMNQ